MALSERLLVLMVLVLQRVSSIFLSRLIAQLCQLLIVEHLSSLNLLGMQMVLVKQRR